MTPIDRLPNDTPFRVFFQRYFLPNLPVIITDVSGTWPADTKWTRDYLLAELQRDHVEVNKLWFSADATFLHDDYEVPEIVRGCLDPAISHTRAKNFRVWINDRGHLTPFHSDTNGLYVFSVQVAGRKRWQLLAPDAPLDLYAFTQFPHLRYNDAIPDELADFVWDFHVEPREMLFLPTFWFHKVVSETDTINVNWVGTRRRQPDNRMHRREREILKAALAVHRIAAMDHLVDLVVGTNEPHYLQNYAGSGGLEFVRTMTAGVSTTAVLRRLLVEASRLPILARDVAKIRRYQESPLAALTRRQSASS